MGTKKEIDVRDKKSTQRKLETSLGLEGSQDGVSPPPPTHTHTQDGRGCLQNPAQLTTPTPRRSSTARPDKAGAVPQFRGRAPVPGQEQLNPGSLHAASGPAGSRGGVSLRPEYPARPKRQLPTPLPPRAQGPKEAPPLHGSGPATANPSSTPGQRGSLQQGPESRRCPPSARPRGRRLPTARSSPAVISAYARRPVGLTNRAGGRGLEEPERGAGSGPRRPEDRGPAETPAWPPGAPRAPGVGSEELQRRQGRFGKPRGTSVRQEGPALEANHVATAPPPPAALLGKPSPTGNPTQPGPRGIQGYLQGQSRTPPRPRRHIKAPQEKSPQA
ncbi:basic salivary proline-rich protein 3-like [Dromiciops gliroides]|uniref:basic salivary proline-rich protein 3-like n=1 Tax=Dromiciops gliroides TaxID=33562 RepID=UPI001CC47D5C|nr:basic salivary proline-rich protein 3-like [Dromiciops gliroides]